MKYARIVLNLLIISFLMALSNSGNATGMNKPDFTQSFDSEKEARVNAVMNLTTKEAFERLKGADFFVNKDLLHKAIFKTYDHRKAEVIDHALRYLTLPQRELINGKFVSRADDFYIAKNIFEVFPDESSGRLSELYARGNAVVKGNVIRSSGRIDVDAISKLLIKALNNKDFCEEETPEMEGIPLRVCDEAYNQLVLRYNIRDVLRTIGNVYTLEVRDYHINILKERLKNLD
jgi:hypothetical protein